MSDEFSNYVTGNDPKDSPINNLSMVQIPPELWRWLNHFCHLHTTTPSDVVNQLLRDFIKDEQKKFVKWMKPNV